MLVRKRLSENKKDSGKQLVEKFSIENCVFSKLFYLLQAQCFQLSLTWTIKQDNKCIAGFVCGHFACLPHGLDVHGLRLPQPLSGGGWRGQRRGVTSVALDMSWAGSVHMVVVMVGRVHMPVAQEQSCVCLCYSWVHTLHGRVHVIHQLLQVHIIICGNRWSDSDSCSTANIH